VATPYSDSPGLVVGGRAEKYLERVAAKELDGLIDRIRHLSPEGLSRVAEVVSNLERPAPTRGKFSGVCGGISPDDAAAMKRAVEDCERVDPRGW
jgi:hypothetical protein